MATICLRHPIYFGKSLKCLYFFAGSMNAAIALSFDLLSATNIDRISWGIIL